MKHVLQHQDSHPSGHPHGRRLEGPWSGRGQDPLSQLPETQRRRGLAKTPSLLLKTRPASRESQFMLMIFHTPFKNPINDPINNVEALLWVHCHTVRLSDDGRADTVARALSVVTK